MRITNLVLIGSLLVVTGCATQKELTYTEYATQFPAQEQKDFKRVIFKFNHAMCDQGDCMVKEKRLNQAVQVIAEQNNTVKSLTDANNKKVEALHHCGYANYQKDLAIEALEDKAFRDGLICSAKTLLTGAMCIVPLLQ